MRHSKASVYALFIDFRREFDAVPHNSLWHTVYQIGLSAKIIRVIKSLYDEATFTVRVNNCHSRAFDVTEGVLQGETLSPLLFSLFISDFETHLRRYQIEGLNIDGPKDLPLLLYADDAVALTASPVHLRKIIKGVESYCFINGLQVNTSKTQIMHFRRGGIATKEVFKYENETLKIVKTYMYLGVLLSSSSLGTCACENAIKKANCATAATLAILAKSGSGS